MDSSKDVYLSYDDIIKQCKDAGIDVTWRKLNYYKFLGLLPKSVRMKGDKRGYYPEGVVYCLRIYHFLQNQIALSLDEIKKWVDDFRARASNKDHPELLGVFAYWIDLTYEEFLKRAVRFFNKFEDVRLGAATMSDINYFYKMNWDKTELAAYLKKDVVEQHMGEFKESAKRWAEKAAERMSISYNLIKKEEAKKKKG